MLEKIIVGVLGALVTSSIVENKMKQYDTETIRPVDTVSIIVSSFNENRFIETCLSSIRNQSIIEEFPEYFELVLADSCSTDNTIELAETYVDSIIITPRGKLTSRNVATDEAKGNLIVNVDADTFYPVNWLNTLLKPFRSMTGVVGTFGSTFDNGFSYVPGPLFSISENIYNIILNKNRMTGRNSAYMKHAFYLAGKFNENINQFHIWDIFTEEECNFGDRLAKFGKVVYQINASCFHLGGTKSAGRIGIGNKKVLDKYQFGKERF